MFSGADTMQVGAKPNIAAEPKEFFNPLEPSEQKSLISANEEAKKEPEKPQAKAIPEETPQQNIVEKSPKEEVASNEEDTEMHLNYLGEMGKQHWKEHLPKMYRELQKNGTLMQKLVEAQEKTQDELNELHRQGVSQDQAWEMVREKYLLLRPRRSMPQENSKPPKNGKTPNLHDGNITGLSLLDWLKSIGVRSKGDIKSLRIHLPMDKINKYRMKKGLAPVLPPNRNPKPSPNPDQPESPDQTPNPTL